MTACRRPVERSRTTRAFTMVEMVTSCLILSLLMLALGYGLKLALVSTGAGAKQAAMSREATDVVERVTDDLNEAMDFTERTEQAVTFTVPDRGPDPAPGATPPPPDEIRYKWWPNGGTLDANDGGLIDGLLGVLDGSTDAQTVPPYVLTRQVNGGPVSVLAHDVRHFNLRYLYRSMSPPAPPRATSCYGTTRRSWTKAPPFRPRSPRAAGRGRRFAPRCLRARPRMPLPASCCTSERMPPWTGCSA